MNEHGRDDHEQSYPGQYPDVLADHALGERISHFLQEQAQHVEFTPQLREQFLHKIPAHRERSFQPLFVVAFASVAILILALTFNVYLSQLTQPAISHEIHYTSSKQLSVASELAQGGQLVSVDPTNQRVVYQPAQQSGVFYTAHLNNPIASNTLAMRDAQDMAWSPDGSALVATVSSEGTALPLLALVPDGQYMHLLGHDALAATWSPTDPQQITYVIPDHGQTQLWSTSKDGKSTKLVSTMPLAPLVKHMLWSPDGHYLALTVVSGTTLTPATLNQPAHALYIVDMQTNTMQTFTAPIGSSIANLEWSPDGKNLAYEQVDNASKSLLQIVNPLKLTDHFSITPQHQLLGWSWSPDGRAIVYSDGGALRTHVLHGQTIIFPQSSTKLVSPFWLKNGTILCVQVKQSMNTLELLSPDKK
jgi:WD40 repeat protein